MSTIQRSLAEPSPNQLSESLEPLSITETCVSPEYRDQSPFDSLEGSTMIQAPSGTLYCMKWYTSTSGKLASLIGTLTERLSKTKLDE